MFPQHVRAERLYLRRLERHPIPGPVVHPRAAPSINILPYSSEVGGQAGKILDLPSPPDVPFPPLNSTRHIPGPLPFLLRPLPPVLLHRDLRRIPPIS